MMSINNETFEIIFVLIIMQFLIFAAASSVFASPLKRNNYQFQPPVPQYQQTSTCPSGFVRMDVNVIEERTWLVRTAQRMFFLDQKNNCLFEWKHTYWGFGRAQTRGKACVTDTYAKLVNKKEDADLVNVRGISYELKDDGKQLVTVDLPGAVLRTGEGEFRQCGKRWRS
jgi:hypothetical protein